MSLETLVMMFRRFDTQHTLRKAPLSFVHGAIVAVDTVLAMMAYNEQSRRPYLQVNDTLLPALDTALEGLSKTWKIAADARNGLRNLLDQHQLQRQNQTNKTTSPGTTPSTVTSSPQSSDLAASEYETAILIDASYDDPSAGSIQYHGGCETEFFTDMNSLFDVSTDSLYEGAFDCAIVTGLDDKGNYAGSV